MKPANPKQYMESLEKGELDPDFKVISAAERLFEFMLNASRLTEGFDEALFEQRTGLTAGLLRDKMQPAVGKGLIASHDDRIWRVTPLGRRFLADHEPTRFSLLSGQDRTTRRPAHPPNGWRDKAGIGRSVSRPG